MVEDEDEALLQTAEEMAKHSLMEDIICPQAMLTQGASTCTVFYSLSEDMLPNDLNGDRATKSPPHRPTLEQAAKQFRNLSHISLMTNINSTTGSYSQLSYVGQDCQCMPPALAQLYGSRVHCLDLSFNCLTSLDGVGKFFNLEELVLDNNNLGDSIVIPSLPRLHTLSLNKNNICNLELLLTKVLNHLPSLTYLSLLGNTACPNQLSDAEKDDEDYQRYRYYVLHRMPGLHFLDSTRVSTVERSEASRRGRFMKVISPDTTHMGDVPTNPRPPFKLLAGYDHVGSRYLTVLKTYVGHQNFTVIMFTNLKFLKYHRIQGIVDSSVSSLSKLTLKEVDSNVGSSDYTPLPLSKREMGDHIGAYGKCRYRYSGKNSEGNRFIRNNDL
uniref:(California timema) hypothetical protein n=1 Tax=Timema californicum TaxID=61474 RepID=A0A7R9J7K1_TIMCA|nr:unnamed protein product [Timema californicum]